MKKNILALFILVVSIQAHTQLIAVPKTAAISVTTIAAAASVVPIEVTFFNPTRTAISTNIYAAIDTATVPSETRISAEQFRHLSLVNTMQSVTINGGATVAVPLPITLVIDASFITNGEKSVYIQFRDDAGPIGRVKVNIEGLLSLHTYLSSPYKLDEVTKVVSDNNILTVSGYKDSSSARKKDRFVTRRVQLEYGKVLVVRNFSISLSSIIESLSLYSVPFKVRPQLTTKINGIDTVFLKNSSAGVANVGLNIDIPKVQWDRYFSNGKKSTHKLCLGWWFAPSVEELDYATTKAFLKKDVKSKQLMLSTGTTLSYTYNDISFVFVPYGWDIPLSSIGRSWIYKGKHWWGFGIGISPKLIGSIFNSK